MISWSANPSTMAAPKSQPSLDGPSNMVNCQVSWSVNNGYIPLNGVPGTYFNVCNKCSWLNTWHYGRSFPKTMGLPRHSWFQTWKKLKIIVARSLLTIWLFQPSASCPLCASLLKYCQWSHVGRLSIHMSRCEVSLQFLWHFMVDWGVRIWFIYLLLSISESLL